MTQARVAPIVEGHGEVLAIRTLLQRTWTEIVGADYLEVLQPIRQPRTKLVRKPELQKAVGFAISKLANAPGIALPGIVLILVDADDDLACVLGPTLLAHGREEYTQSRISSVVATIDYESWLIGGADTLGEYLSSDTLPSHPETARAGKGWLKRHFKGDKYSETVDQPAMTAAMDLAKCRVRCPSFDKLCRDLASFAMEVQAASVPAE